MFFWFEQKINHSGTAQSARNITVLLLAVTMVGVSFILFSFIFTWILLLVVCSAMIRAAICCYYYKYLPSARALNLVAVLSVSCLIYTALSSRLLIGMINLLILACALKLMQIRIKQGVYQLIISLFVCFNWLRIYFQSVHRL
jgi:hypothetical protein